MSEGTRDAASAQHRRLLDTIGMRIVEGELAPGARLLTADVAATARSHQVFEDCRNWLKPSDHVPIMTEFDL